MRSDIRMLWDSKSLRNRPAAACGNHLASNIRIRGATLIIAASFYSRFQSRTHFQVLYHPDIRVKWGNRIIRKHSPAIDTVFVRPGIIEHSNLRVGNHSNSSAIAGRGVVLFTSNYGAGRHIWCAARGIIPTNNFWPSRPLLQGRSRLVKRPPGCGWEVMTYWVKARAFGQGSEWSIVCP